MNSTFARTRGARTPQVAAGGPATTRPVAAAPGGGRFQAAGSPNALPRRPQRSTLAEQRISGASRTRRSAWVLAALLWALAPLAEAGIPEPDLVWYGQVTSSSGGTPVRITSGTLVWQIEPLAGGPSIVLTTRLTNINDQFSFALRVPCESPEPGFAASTNVIQLTAPPASYRRLTVMLDGQPLSLAGTAGEFSPLPSSRGRAERIDLQLGTTPIDADGDGLADAWEMQHFGALTVNPGDDPDGDRLSNMGEFRAGTNPVDPMSRFEMIEISTVANGISVRWSSQPDRKYRVRRSPVLLAPSEAYGIVQAGIVATPPVNQFIDTTVGEGAQFFYLIEIEQ